MPSQELPQSRKLVEGLLENDDTVFSDSQAWNNRQSVVKKWLDDLKDWEDEETFDRAFQDDRMTIRGIGAAPCATDDSWKLGSKVSFSTKASGVPSDVTGTVKASPMNLHKGVAGIKKLLEPANFATPIKPLESHNRAMTGNQKTKYVLGLHDLSATLLTHTRAISDQFKPYEKAIWVFMPVPQQEDHLTFYLLNQRAKEPNTCNEFKQYVRVLASRIMRIKYSQASDMHTTYIDVGGLNYYSPPKQGVSIRYGVAGSELERRDCDLVYHQAKNQFDDPTKGWNKATPTMFIISQRNKPLVFQVMEKGKCMFKRDETEALKNQKLTVQKKALDEQKEKLAEWQDALSKLKALLSQVTPQAPLSEINKQNALNMAARCSGYGIWTQKMIGLDGVKKRREAALKYKSILSSEWNNRGRGANEIVMAYREHGNPGTTNFPLYAELDLTDKKFYVLRDNFTRKGPNMTDAGVYANL